jgi:hypothetical protein
MSPRRVASSKVAFSVVVVVVVAFIEVVTFGGGALQNRSSAGFEQVE